MKTSSRWVVFCLMVLAFLAPLKFGTPVVLPTVMLPPLSGWEWIYSSWPNQLLPLFACVLLLWLALDSNRLPARVDWLFVLPGLFLVTQLVAAPTSICRQTTTDTFMHFAVCVTIFYAAAWYVRNRVDVAWVFGGLTVATLLVVIFAAQQYFGGLAETRAYAATYGETISQELRLRLMSNRVFGTLIYPNALAGFLVVGFAPGLAWIWNGRMRRSLKWLTLIFVGGLMLVCLALTGSRGGFIAFAVMVVVGLLAASRRVWLILAAVAVIAVVFVTAHQAGLIHHGLASASARGDYWRGAVAIARDHPWLGTGPGTFGSIYPKYKTATTEEAQLVHNSYLQMWSDSGAAGAVVFALLWLAALWDGFRLVRKRNGDLASIAVLAAITGWMVHGFIDFDLYVPGVALPAFLLLGVLQGLKPVPQRAATRQPRLALGTAGVALVLVVVWLEGRSLRGDFCVAQAQTVASNNPSQAAKLATQAINCNPNNPRYWSMAGDLALHQGRATEAVEFYRGAAGNDPYRASYHWRLARALLLAGNRKSEAVEQMMIATDLNPTRFQLNPTRFQQGAEWRVLEENIRQSGRGLLESLPFEKGP